jgi:hypothetical protein
MMEIKKVSVKKEFNVSRQTLILFSFAVPSSVDYMNNNPSLWMFTTLKDCCDRYYSWDVVTCLSSGFSFVDPTRDLFYPDWGKTNTCINDGQAPPYMKKASSDWMYSESST